VAIRGGAGDRGGRGAAGDRGAAVVEFVMIAVLLMFLLFAVLQVAVYFYIRNIVTASATRGARYAANAGIAYPQGGTHARALIGQGLSPSVARAVPCAGSAGTDAATGLPLAVVRCKGHVTSIFLPIGRFVTIEVTSRALKEAPP
jgi:Flp pilus assembly protein TadG